MEESILPEKRKKLQNEAELCILAKRFARAFEIYEKLDDKDGMKDVTLHLIEGFRAFRLGNGAQCIDDKIHEETLCNLIGNKVVAHVLLRQLTTAEEMPLLYYIARQIKDEKYNRISKYFFLLVANTLMREFKKNPKTIFSPFKIFGPVKIIRWQSFVISARRIGVVYEIFQEYSPELMKKLAPYVEMLLKARYSHFYASIAMDVLKACKDFKRLRKWLFKENSKWFRIVYSRIIFDELSDAGDKEGVAILKKKFEKSKRLRYEDIKVYIDILEYLEEEYDINALLEFCLKQKKRISLDWIGLCKKYGSNENRIKMANALKMQNLYYIDDIITFYKLAGDMQSINHCIKEALAAGDKSVDKKHRMRVLEIICLTKGLVKELSQLLVIQLVRKCINEGDASKIWDLLQSNDIALEQGDYAVLAKRKLELGYIDEKLFKLAGIEITVETYQNALACLRCDKLQADRYVEKIKELSSE